MSCCSPDGDPSRAFRKPAPSGPGEMLAKEVVQDTPRGWFVNLSKALCDVINHICLSPEQAFFGGETYIICSSGSSERWDYFKVLGNCKSPGT